MDSSQKKMLGNLCVFAARYCHNRSTGAPLATIWAFKEFWHELDDVTKNQIVHESHEATKSLQDWEEFREWAKKTNERQTPMNTSTNETKDITESLDCRTHSTLVITQKKAFEELKELLSTFAADNFKDYLSGELDYNYYQQFHSIETDFYLTCSMFKTMLSECLFDENDGIQFIIIESNDGKNFYTIKKDET